MRGHTGHAVINSAVYWKTEEMYNKKYIKYDIYTHTYIHVYMCACEHMYVYIYTKEREKARLFVFKLLVLLLYSIIFLSFVLSIYAQGI